MRFLTCLVLTLACLVCIPAQAQCRSGYCYRPSGRYVTARPAPSPVAWQPVCAAPQAAPAAQAQTTGDYGSALALINGARAAIGRGPLAWDANLAAWALRNPGGHAVMAPGAAQCWAGVHDPVTAVRMWFHSPAHNAILMGATSVIGIGVTSGGTTANAR